MNPVVFAVLALLLSAVALYAVALPLLPRSRAAQVVDTSSQEELEELLAQREAAFQALRELNFDRRVGKVSEEDFAQFEGNLKQHAADTLRALDAWEARTDEALDDALEREIEARRAVLAGGSDGGSQGAWPCPACGAAVAAADKFCGTCGHALSGTPRIPAPAPVHGCPYCGAPTQPGDRFCPKCGQPVAELMAQR